MTTASVPESPLRKEGRLFVEWSDRFINALVNKVFELSPQAASIRFVSLLLLFFLTAFLISLIYYPPALWLQRIADILNYVFIESYRITYVGNPITSLLDFVWLVFTDPRSLHFLPIMLASFFISLQSAAIYLADIFNLEDVSIARRHISEVSTGWGGDQPIRFTKGDIAEESKNSPNFLIGGPGKVIVDLDTAVLFEKPDGTPHVIGPTAGQPGGRATIEGFERFREAIDLRDHFIDLRDQDEKSRSVKSRSQDGIPITATNVSFLFSILRSVDEKNEEKKPVKRTISGFFFRKPKKLKENQLEEKKEPDPYPFSKRAVENIVYKAPSQVTPDQSNPSTYKFSWINNMIGLIRGELGSFMSQRNLTAYLASINLPEREQALNRENKIVEQARKVIPPHESQPDPRNIPPLPEFTPRYKITDLFSEFASKFKEKARDRGVELRWIGVGTWQTMNTNVFENHLDAWKLSRENQANGNEDALNGLKGEIELTETMELIQEIPLISYHQAVARTTSPLRVTFSMVVDFRKQLIQAKDLWIHKGKTPPNVLLEAIDHLDNVLFRFRQSTPFHAEDVVSAEAGQAATEPESEVPTPGAVAYDELVRLVNGDVETANRLIEYEKTQFPNDSLDILIERAIERLIRDRER